MKARQALRSASFVSFPALTLALTGKLDGRVPWLAGFLAVALASGAVSEGLSRKNTRLHVFAQSKRRWISAVAVGSSFAVAAACFLYAHWVPLRDKPPAHLQAYLGLGFFVGFATRRVAGRALSPSSTDSEALNVKAQLYLLLTAAAVPFPYEPGTSHLEQAAYILGFAVGIGMHWIERELEYRVSHARVLEQLAGLEQAVTRREMDALDALFRGLPHAAKQLVKRTESYESRMIEAMAELAENRPREAIGHLEDAIQAAKEATQHPEEWRNQAEAKAWVLLARAAHDSGDSAGVLVAIDNALKFDQDCPVCTVIRITHADPNTLTRDVAKQAHLDVLEAQELARDRSRAPIRNVGNQIVKHAFGVDQAFFMDALALTLIRMGNLIDARKVLDEVLHLAPQSAMARYHHGLLFEALRDKKDDDGERQELANLAMIAYGLAVEYAPARSLTAERAAERLDVLGGERKRRMA